jgi:hypothetical protein
MLSFLSTYWLGILLIGGMLVMHLGHRGHGGGHDGGCGAGHGAGHGDHDAAAHRGPSIHTDDTESNEPGVDGTEGPVGGHGDHSARTPAVR